MEGYGIIHKGWKGAAVKQGSPQVKVISNLAVVMDSKPLGMTGKIYLSLENFSNIIF